MSLVAIVGFLNVFVASILAGEEIVIHYGLRAPAEALDERSQIQLRKGLVRRLRILVPAFFVPAAASGIAGVALGGGAPALWFRCAGLLALFAWTMIRVVGTVPINRATLTWQPAAPPRDWKAQVDRAERFHIVGVWAALVGAASFSTALALEVTTR